MYSYPPIPSDPPPPARSRKRSSRRSAEAERALAKARRLRRTMSVPERLLWRALRNNRLGVKFRRQHPLGVYTLDFYCHAALLVVELDGGSHAERAAQDRVRDAWLRAQGLEVLRYGVPRFMKDQDAVVEHILRRVRARLEREA